MKFQIPKRGVKYWIVGLAVLFATLVLTPVIDQRVDLKDLKNFLFLHLSRSTTAPQAPRWAKLVLINDDVFWEGELDHRSPTNRKYLAKLIRALDQADAKVIALDFDLRLPNPDKGFQVGRYPEDVYKEETDDLIKTIGDVAQRRRIVLAKNIEYASTDKNDHAENIFTHFKKLIGEEHKPYALVGEIYQPYGICTPAPAHPDGRGPLLANPGTADYPLVDAAPKNISCGYIALMPDKRMVPPPAHIAGASARLDSFPTAIVRAALGDAAVEFGEGDVYASYVARSTIENPTVSFSASELLRNPAALRGQLQGAPVIVGAHWHSRQFGKGLFVDNHDTPIGSVVGALIHENLTEAMLVKRTYPALPEPVQLLIEIAIGLAALWAFAWSPSWLAAIGGLVGAAGVLFLLQWMSLQLFGVFIDMFLPVLGLGLHAIADRLLEGGHSPHAPEGEAPAHSATKAKPAPS